MVQLCGNPLYTVNHGVWSLQGGAPPVLSWFISIDISTITQVIGAAALARSTSTNLEIPRDVAPGRAPKVPDIFGKSCRKPAKTRLSRRDVPSKTNNH